MDDKHILVSLGDDKVKQIGEVIGNKTCNKILDLLAENEMTVTDISKKLKIPLNTTDYNIKKLVKAGLIEKASHFWSIKGKKIPVYRVSNRKIIISPKRSVGKIFAWTLGITGLSALTIREFTKRTFGGVAPMVSRSFQNDVVTKEASAVMAIPELETLSMNAGTTDAVLTTISSPGFWQSLSPWAWFLFGAWFAVLLFFILTIYNERKTRGSS